MNFTESDRIANPVHQKLKWISPQIVLMLAQETDGKLSNPREGGNATEGFLGPS